MTAQGCGAAATLGKWARKHIPRRGFGAASRCYATLSEGLGGWSRPLLPQGSRYAGNPGLSSLRLEYHHVRTFYASSFAARHCRTVCAVRGPSVYGPVQHRSHPARAGDPAGAGAAGAAAGAGLAPLGADPQLGARPGSRQPVDQRPGGDGGRQAAFRTALRQRRCLVAADGFYEWQHAGRAKQAFFLHFRDDRPFAFAGLWEAWEGPQQARLETCTLLTTEANALIRPIHDRMPVILPPDAYQSWLDPAVQDRGSSCRCWSPARATRSRPIRSAASSIAPRTTHRVASSGRRGSFPNPGWIVALIHASCSARNGRGAYISFL